MKAHPEHAEKQKKIIEKSPYFTREQEALEYALNQTKAGTHEYQIWVKLEKDEEFYGFQNYWIATDNTSVKLAAEYIGMALVYDDIRLSQIVTNHIKIDEVLADTWPK